MIPKNTWVLIHKVILKPEERVENLPDDTKNVPLEMWVKGFLLEDSGIGQVVKIKTRTNRIEEGTLIEANPSFKHNYGEFVPEILQIDRIVLKTLYGEDYE